MYCAHSRSPYCPVTLLSHFQSTHYWVREERSHCYLSAVIWVQWLMGSSAVHHWIWNEGTVSLHLIFLLLLFLPLFSFIHFHHIRKLSLWLLFTVFTKLCAKRCYSVAFAFFSVSKHLHHQISHLWCWIQNASILHGWYCWCCVVMGCYVCIFRNRANIAWLT